MSFKKYLIFLLFFFSIIWISGEEKSITLFATSDLHGNIDSEGAGILRLATVLKKEITTVGGFEKSIIIDCGDFSQGGIESSLTKGGIIFELLDHLHYDVIIPGNHDFDYGLEKLIANQKAISSEMLCGNLLLFGAKNPFKSWKIFNKNGLKIAVMGVTYPGIKGIDSGNNFSYKTDSINETIKKILPEVVSEKPDLIVLAAHGGRYNSGWSLKNIIRKFPEIDIVFAGHTHEEIPGELLYNRIYFIQTGSHAKYLGEAIVKISNGKKSINSRLIPVFGAKVDQALAEKIKSSLNNLKIGANKIIARSKNKVDLSLLTMNSMIEKTKADVAILGLSEFSRYIKGKIRYKDVFSIIPYEDTIVTMVVNRSELQTILQELYSYMKKKRKYKRVLFTGFSLKQVHGKITNLKFDKKNFDEEKIVLTLSSYYIEYPSNKFPEIKRIAKNSRSEYKNTGVLIRDTLIAYLANLR